LTSALQNLPKTLNETYDRIIDAIPKQHEVYAIRILQFLVYSTRPLRLEEIVDAVIVQPDKDPCFEPKNRMPDPREITTTCSGLVSVVNEKLEPRYLHTGEVQLVLQLAHFSVKEYFTGKHCKARFRDYISEIPAREAIVQISISYMDHVEKVGSAWLRFKSSLHTTTDKYQQRQQRGKMIHTTKIEYPFWMYCTASWMDHANLAASSQCIMEQVLKLASSQTPIKLYCFTTLDFPYGSPVSLLYCASLENYRKIVELLLAHGKNVDEQSGKYGNALQAAAIRGNEDIVKILIEAGANVDAQGGVYGNALQAAAISGNEDIVKILIEAGANVNAQGGEYGNALIANISQHKANAEIVKLLIGAGADFKARSKKYGDAIEAAAQNDHKNIIRILRYTQMMHYSRTDDLTRALDNRRERGLKIIMLESNTKKMNKRKLPLLD
jgi:hypothetical protein